MTKKQVLLRVVLLLGIVALLVVGGIALRQYMLPFHRTAEMTVCNLAGETKTVEVSVDFRRHILAPTSWRGSVTFDGVTYSDFTTFHPNQWWQRPADLKGKWREVTTSVVENRIADIFPSSIPLFTKSPFEEDDEQLNFYGFGVGDDFEIAAIMVGELIPQENALSNAVLNFFGPAETVEEAERIKREIFRIELNIPLPDNYATDTTE